MSACHVIHTTFQDYLKEEFPAGADSAAAGCAAEEQEHQRRLAAFPHSTVLQLAYPELDLANWWCWQQFGPARGECHQASSDRPACDQAGHHMHDGRWLTQWLAKTSYDFGFNAWYFAEEADQLKFLAFVPQLEAAVAERIESVRAEQKLA